MGSFRKGKVERKRQDKNVKKHETSLLSKKHCRATIVDVILGSDIIQDFDFMAAWLG